MALTHNFKYFVMCDELHYLSTELQVYSHAFMLSNLLICFSFRLRNRKICPNNGTRIKHCADCLDFPSSGTTYFSKIRIDFRRLVLIPEDTTFALKFGRYPPPLASAGDCFSQAHCPQGTFKLNLTDTGISLDPSVTWRNSGYFVSKKIDKSADGSVVVGRCGGYCGMCTPNELKVRCIDS